jgi:hypothetical protein
MMKRVSLFALIPLAAVLTLFVAFRSDTAANAQSTTSPNDVVAASRGSGGEFDRSITTAGGRASESTFNAFVPMQESVSPF